MLNQTSFKNLHKYLFISFILWHCSSCSTGIKYLQRSKEVHIATVNNNVCKKLVGEVVLYAIFVDSKYTSPWTEYDIHSTIDSVKKTVNWIEGKAKIAGIPLNIDIDYHQNDEKIVPI